MSFEHLKSLNYVLFKEMFIKFTEIVYFLKVASSIIDKNSKSESQRSEH